MPPPSCGGVFCYNNPVPRVFDAFTFFGELDLLELRLRYLWDAVDYFVVVEATRTFSGKPKPLYFQENKSRFGWAMPKIQHVVVDDLTPNPDNEGMWANEEHQRRQIIRGLGTADWGDYVMVGDVDEFPKAEIVADMRHERGPNYLFMMTAHCYFTDWFCPAIRWHGTAAVLFDGKFDAQNTRNDRFLYEQYWEAGWHFSYMGGVDIIRRKLSSFSHSELDTPEMNNEDHIRKQMEEGMVFFDGSILVPFPHADLPPILLDHRDRYAGLFAP